MKTIIAAILMFASSLTAAEVRFREAPRSEPYGKVAVFEDLYGNGWDLIQPTMESDR